MPQTRVHASQDVWEPVEFMGIKGVFGNVRVRELRGLKGQLLPGHTHNYSHAEAVVRGKGMLRFTYPDGRVTERLVEAPEIFDVPAEVLHEVRCDSPMIIWCIFAVRDSEAGEIIEFIKAENLNTTDYME